MTTIFVDHFRAPIDDDFVVLRKEEYEALADSSAAVVRPQVLVNVRGMTSHVVLLRCEYDELIDYGRSNAIFYIHMPEKDVHAAGHFSCDTRAPWIIVFRGSTLGREVRSLEEPYVQKREELKSKGIVVLENGIMKFAQHHTFENAGEAARVIEGCPVSVNLAWKDRDGKTFADRGYLIP
jgi:hypothetical protein